MTTSRSALQRLLIPAVGIVVAIGSAPLVTIAAPAVRDASPTRIGTVAYDRVGEALVIPVQGKAPAVHVRRLAPRQYVADLADSVLVIDQVQGQRLTSPVLAGWSLDETAEGGTVRLRLTMNEDVKPLIQVSRQDGQVVVQFKSNLARRPVVPGGAAPRLAAAPKPVASVPASEPSPLVWLKGLRDRITTAWAPAPAEHKTAQALPPAPVKVVRAPQRSAPAPKPMAHAAAKPQAPRTTPVAVPVAPARKAPFVPVEHPSEVAVLGAPRLDAKRNLIVVPVVEGSLPQPELRFVKLNDRWAYLDVPGTRPAFGGVRYQSGSDAVLDRWVMARRPGRNITRLSIALKQDADLAIKASGREILVAVRPKAVMLGAAPAAHAAPVAVAARPSRPAPVPVAQRLVPKAPAVAVASQVRRPFFDETRYGLVVPFKGSVPLYRYTQVDATHVSLDLKGQLLHSSDLMQRFERHPLMASWQLQGSGTPGVVRVSLAFRKPAELVVAADDARKQLLLIPQPSLSREEAAAEAAGETTTYLSAIERDALSHHIFIPFSGQVPAYTVEHVTPTFAYIHFTRSQLQPDGVHFFSPDHHPSLNYWLLSQASTQRSVRLALALTQPGGAQVYEDREHQRLVVVVGDGTQASVPGRSAQQWPGRWFGETRPAAQRPGYPGVSISQKAS